MEKRAFLAVVLSIVVFYIFSMFMGPDKKVAAPVSPQNTASVSATVAQPVNAPLTTSTLQPAPVSGIQKDVRIETDLYTAVFSSRGAALKSITLKKYREQNSPTASPVILGNNADPALLNFSTRSTGFDLSDSATYITDSDSVTLTGKKTRQLVFTYVSGQGFTVRKVYELSADSYSVKLDTQVLNNSAAAMVGTIQHVMTYPLEPKVKDNRFDTAGSYIFADTSLQSNKAKDVASASKKYEKNVQREWCTGNIDQNKRIGCY